VGQVDLKALYLWRRSQKIRTPNWKKIFRVQTKWPVAPFKPFYRFWCQCYLRQKATCYPLVLVWKSPTAARRQSVKGKPAVVRFQQKRVFQPTIIFVHTILLWCSLRNAIMMQLHHHCFITFWSRPWVLKLKGMKGLQ